MSEHHRTGWGGRVDGMWWQEAISAAAGEQPQAMHQQHLLHQQMAQQQQSAAAAAAVAAAQQQQQQQPQQQQSQQQPPQQQQQQSSQQQQQPQQIQSSTSPSPQQQVFSYKMASSFQNPATTVSNVSSTSPLGAAGIRGYDYRLGGGMAAGNPAMSAPAPAAQWWYSSAMDNSLQNTLQNNMQSNLGQNNIPSSIQSLQSVQTPPSVSQAQLAHQAAAEAHIQHQEAQRHHQQVAAAEAHHRQAVEQARQHHQLNHQQQLQNHLGHQQQQQVQQQQVQQQLHQNHHQLQQQQQQVQQQVQQQPAAPPPPAPVTHKRMPRGKGGDARPRGRMTAYAFFVQTCREEHKKKHPDENVVFAEFSKKCAERWKTMLDKEKKRFHEMAEKDKKRYDAEMLNYTPPKGEKQRGKKRKQVKDPNAPKRSLSAFFWFCNDERAKVKSINPEYGVGDIAKELGRRWSDADPESKGKYEVMAEQDKARYEKEMTAYKKRNLPVMQPVVVPEPEEEDEEEDGDDDDDD